MTTPRRTKISLPDVAVVAAQGVEAVAKRVDGVLSHLTDQLANFEAADSSELGGVPATSVISGSNSMYYQTFEDDVDEDWITYAGATTGITYTNNGQAGGRAVRTTAQRIYLADNINVPFDPSRLYRIRTRIRRVAGNGGVYVGVVGMAADGTTLVNRAGADSSSSQNIVCASVANPSSSWVTYEGYFKGTAATGNGSSPSTDASAPRVLDDLTRYIRPYFNLDYNALGGTFEIDYITMEILTETLEANELLTKVDGRNATDISATVKSGSGVADNKCDGDGLATGSVGGADAAKVHIQAGTITATDIKALTITAAEIAATTITAGKLASLTGGGLTINFAATGSNKVLDHSNFYLTAAGDAVFSGVVSASSFTGSSATFTMGQTANYQLAIKQVISNSPGIIMGYNGLGTKGSGKIYHDYDNQTLYVKSDDGSIYDEGHLKLIAEGSDGELYIDGGKLLFYSSSGTPVSKQTVTGSRGGNAALASLLTALDSLGLITDSTT